ncbi:hypothetical protein Taro_001777, partial [Colocasia esculenta]|nr:hypothetical protein [Colocasia esculenta]
PFLPLSLFPSSQVVEGSLRRSDAVERPGARAEWRRVRGARRRRPTDARALSWGGFSILSVPHCPSCTAVTAWLCLVSVGIVGLALGRPVFLVVPARCSLSSVVPFEDASPWWHRRVWLPDLAVYPGSGVVLLVGPRLCGGLRWPCLQ